MNLKTIFTKPVDRPIEGVIKADDEASLRLEVEEYVLTNEVEKRLEAFLDAYNNYEGANGVWVSGFFGSGKSHLLKMLALLLENRQIDGVPTLDLFLPKCRDNEILRGDLKRAVAIPSKSILFNIDQKADVISKTQIDALLAVFVKVFDEMCGYYGKQGHIAQFERDLDSRGLYEEFKSAYKSIAGGTWHKGREQALLEARNIAKAYAEVTGADEASAIGILDKYRSQYRVSIEDFAEKIHAYIERQPTGFRLNFFVDEVGQYIAENIKLMTNLQTIAESLATKCRGRAWIIVTAQEDMGTVVGEMGRQQANDFSKIQARFANRMKLTSADVAEVIQKRLLSKTDDGVQLLSSLYHEQSNNFRTLFDFADGSQTYRNFQDREHFVHCYPFIPYQFALFQSVIQNLSLHNAFEGKHSSVGERSMLGVFQQVAIHISDHQIGQLATFDLMFEGIRTALKSNIQRAIIQAENHLDNPFAIRLLKTLFLVKYVKEYKATVRNLSVLMLDAFHQDLPALKRKLEEALSLLEQQTYIQRNGELYEFLTDEEKDIEQEIKNTEVETSDVADELAKLIFDNAIKHRKIRYAENGQDYPYSRKLDDRLHGHEQELAIHVLSPLGEDQDNPHVLAAKSVGAPTELFVILPPDERLVRDLLMYKRTEKYIRQNFSVAQRDEVKKILSEKGFQNQDRYQDLKQRVSQLIGKAQIYLAGSELEIGGEDPQSRIIKGFGELIARTYPNLRMLRGFSYTEEKIRGYLEDAGDTLWGSDATALSEPEHEILAMIRNNNRASLRTTLKNLVEKFERKPYGWHYAAILCNLAKLCARGKVEVRADGSLLEDDELERALRNSRGHGNVVLEPQVEFTASQVRALKVFFADFFDAPPNSAEAKALGQETGKAMQEMIRELEPLVSKAQHYPFLNALNPVLEKLKDLTGKPYTWYLTELIRQEDSLLDMKESIIDPIRKFMSGQQKGIFDKARKFVETQNTNFAYIMEDGTGKESEVREGGLSGALIRALDDPECYKGSHMQQVKNQVETLQQKVAAQVEAEIAEAKERIANLEARLCDMPEFGALSREKQEQLTSRFREFVTSIERQHLIAFIRDAPRRFEEKEYQQILEILYQEGNGSDGDDRTLPINRDIPSVSSVSSVVKNMTFSSAWLVNEADVDRYLESVRKALLEEIRQGKRIQI